MATCFTRVLYFHLPLVHANMNYIHEVIMPYSALTQVLFSGTIIIHEAWDEPDSVNPAGLNTQSSLHGQGLEATISVSEAIQTLPMIESRDYSSDDSLLPTLASLALCVGFDFVKMNSDSTLSVAIAECFDSQTRYICR